MWKRCRCLAVSEELTLQRGREERKKGQEVVMETKWTFAPRKGAGVRRERMSVIWSLLRGENCVGDRERLMIMKGS